MDFTHYLSKLDYDAFLHPSVKLKMDRFPRGNIRSLDQCSGSQVEMFIYRLSLRNKTSVDLTISFL